MISYHRALWEYFYSSTLLYLTMPQYATSEVVGIIPLPLGKGDPDKYPQPEPESEPPLEETYVLLSPIVIEFG